MNVQFKRLIALLLAGVMLLGLVPALAEDNPEEEITEIGEPVPEDGEEQEAEQPTGNP